MSITPWYKNVRPHHDIQEGHLDESVFAANLSEVASGKGRDIYINPDSFFAKTYFTLGMKNIAKRVVQGLNGGQDAENRVISLQTGFGGGKTHTLISLYHLANWGKKAGASAPVQELLSTTGLPEFEQARVAVFTNSTNDPVQGRTVDGLQLRTIWGELAYQLGGKAAYEIIRPNDEQRTAPKGLFKQVLDRCKPALILIDELADYCVSASAVKVEGSNLADQTISFMQHLTEAVSENDHCVLIATLPASAQEVASSPLAAQILTALENRIVRVGANLKPVEDDEIFEVVRRRLFEDLGDPVVINQVIDAYTYTYSKLWNEIPPYAAKTEYKERLRKAYPFHPELIDMFRLRWASNPYFQRTRGVLRLLAAIVADLWKRQHNLGGSHALIHTSEVSFQNVEALGGQLTTLNGPNWDAVISADVAGSSSNAFRIDKQVASLGQFDLTQGIAATILLGTFGTQGQNKGIGLDELKLCMIKPSAFNHNDINGALDRFENSAHYLYYSTSGQKRYWFHTKPNINILINQAKSDVKEAEIYAEILKRISDKTRQITSFNVLVDPSADIPEQKKPTLIILSPRHSANPAEINGNTRPIIEKLATKKGNSERIYRNTMLFLVCSEIALPKLKTDVGEYLGCQKIQTDYQTQLEKEQKDDLRRRIEEASKQIESSLVTAYNILIKHSVKNGFEKLLIKQFKDSLETQLNYMLPELLKSEEWLLESVGIGTLRRNNLLPTTETPIRAKDVYEAFLRFDDKPMITGLEAVQRSLLRYCLTGEYAIAAGEPEHFTKTFFSENVPFFDITDSNFWLVDKSLHQPTAPAAAHGTDAAPTYPQPAKPDDGWQEPATPPDGSTAESATARELKSITVSGKVDLANYNQVFTSFIMPLRENQVEIEIRIKGKSNGQSRITEGGKLYQVIKESAKQLGLGFEEE
jgi:predicted AAA+ superfamily ATPase